MAENNRLTDDFADIEALTKDPTPSVKRDDLRDRLALAVIASNQLSQRVSQLRQDLKTAENELLLSTGRQDALWPLFLDDSKLTPDQAIEKDLKGLRTVIEAAQKAQR